MSLIVQKFGGSSVADPEKEIRILLSSYIDMFEPSEAEEVTE